MERKRASREIYTRLRQERERERETEILTSRSNRRITTQPCSIRNGVGDLASFFFLFLAPWSLRLRVPPRLLTIVYFSFSRSVLSCLLQKPIFDGGLAPARDTCNISAVKVSTAPSSFHLERRHFSFFLYLCHIPSISVCYHLVPFSHLSFDVCVRR